MPSRPLDILHYASLRTVGHVMWGEQIPHDHPGVYVVVAPRSSIAPLDLKSIDLWMDRVPGIEIDGTPPAVGELVRRLEAFWLPDEDIIYIGKAGTSLRKRVSQFYGHVLGERRPHCGGSWVKTLLSLESSSVYWALSSQPTHDECRMLKAFMGNVSAGSRDLLHDPKLPLPYANLELCCGGKRYIKAHGIGHWKL